MCFTSITGNHWLRADFLQELASLPFGALAKAARALEAQHQSDDDSDSEEDSDEERQAPVAGPSSSRSAAPKKLKVKRPDKHA